jgi:hypothetical protein
MAVNIAFFVIVVCATIPAASALLQYTRCARDQDCQTQNNQGQSCRAIVAGSWA